ncbi:hypothetical protein RKD27_008923 [Streptomyces sp. SAI-126]
MLASIRTASKAARMTAVAVAAVAATVALPTSAVAQTPAPSSASLVCFVNGDGVRIHSQPNASSTVLGPAYSGDNWVESAGSNRDLRTRHGRPYRSVRVHHLVLSAPLLRVRPGQSQ